MKSHFKYVVFLLFNVQLIFSQVEATKWYFGILAGLDFSTSPPTILANGSMTVDQGCSAISNSIGAILFYTDGEKVWNQNHTIMPNGTGLFGDQTPAQSSVVIRKPGSQTLYYIFTVQGVGQSGGVCYSIVDMSLSGGTGSVTVKNAPLYANPCTEAITATKHCNGNDFWILTHDLNSANFRAHLLTSAGVSTPAIISTVGSLHSCGNAYNSTMKFSPNSRKVGVVSFGCNFNQLFDFDNSSGVVSNPLSLQNGMQAYSCEFSGDGTKFYIADAGWSALHQWDLCAGSPTAIIASNYSVSTSGGSLGNIQLALNGKIYVSKSNSTSLGVINNPNLAGAASNYVNTGQSVSPNTSRRGLPNFVTSLFLQRPPPPPFTSTLTPAISCNAVSFSASSTPTLYGCAFSGYSLTSIQWDFGDPSSGAANSSALQNPVHVFSSLGTYTVSLIYQYSCGGGTDTIKQPVTITQPCVQVLSAVSCSALGSATATAINGGGPYSYTWLPVGQTGSICNSIIPGSYTLLVSSPGISTYSIVGAHAPNSLIAGTISATSTLNCNSVNNGTAGVSLSNASASQSYTWASLAGSQFGNTAINLGAGTHTLYAIDLLSGCTYSNVFLINQPPLTTLNLTSSSSTACVGSNFTLSATASGGSPPYIYNWTNGPATSVYVTSVQSTGNSSFTLTATDLNNCVSIGNLTLGIIQNPTLTVTTASTCPGVTATLGVLGANSFTWYPGGSQSTTYTASPLVSTVYTVTGEALSCTSTATTSIYVHPVPTLNFNTFSITCGSLGSATVMATGGIGPYNYTWSPVPQTGSVAINLIPGSYTLLVNDNGTGCNSTGTVQFTPLIPMTGTLAAINSFSCNAQNNGTATIINLTGGSASQNYFWTDGSASYTTASVIGLTAGVWSVTATDALTACQIFSVFTITQPPAQTLNISSSSPTTCAGTSITFTASNSGGTPGTNPAYTYTWVGGPNTDTTTSTQITAGNYVFTVQSSDANNCIATQTIAADWVPNPVLSVSDVSICPLEVGTLTVSGAISYTWHASTPPSSVGSSFTDSPVASAQYTVIGEALSCTAAATASIIIKPAPNPVISHNSPVCENGNLLFSVSSGTAAVWSGPQSFASSSINNTLNIVQLNQGGVYDVTVTAVNSCTATASASLTVKPLPQFSVAPASSSICANTTSVSLSVTASSPALTYTWYPNTNLSISSGSVTYASPASSITYTVIGSLNGCINSAQTTVNVVPPPSLTGQFNSPTLCSQAFNGSPNTITLSANGANTYSLVTIPDMFNANPGGPVSPLTSIPPYTGAGSATLSGSNGVCTVTLGLTFTVLPNPNISVNNYTPVICAGETFTYTNQGASTYTWSSATPGSTLYSNGGIAVASPTINSVFSVFGGSLGCNSALQTTTITVNPLPTLSVNPNPLLLCLGSSAELFGQSNGTSFIWLPPYGLNSYTSQQVSTHINQNQNYTVIATLNNCSNTAVAQVSILPLPSPQIVPVKDEVCLYESIHLKGEGGMYYVWTTPNLQTYTIQNLQLDISHMTLAGTYTLKVVDENACFNYSTHPVVVHDLPNGNLKPERIEFCVPYCNAFTFVPNTQSQITQAGPWSMNSLIYSGNSFTSCFSKAGEFTITGPIQDEFNCKNTVSLLVIGRPKPMAAFYVTPENPVEGLDEVSFVNVTSNIIGYSWQSTGASSTPLGMTPSTVNSWQDFKSEESSPTYVFQEAGVYGLMLMVKNEFNCWDTVMHTIKVESDFAAYIPNAFTPNDDGLNDTFYPVMRGVKKFELQIFDRWGELIFKSTETNQVWDGSFQGQECKQDVYNYKLVLLNVKGTEKVYSGSITLYR